MAKAKKIIKKIKKSIKGARKSRAKASVKKTTKKVVKRVNKRVTIQVPCECVKIFKAGLINEHELCPECKGTGTIKKRVKV